MKKSILVLMSILIVFSLFTYKGHAFTTEEGYGHHYVIQIDHNKGDIPGNESPYIITKVISYDGKIKFAENERYVQVETLINGEVVKSNRYNKSLEPNAMPQEFIINVSKPVMFYNAKKSYSFNDEIKAVFTSYDEAGKIIEKKELFKENFSRAIPDGETFAKSPSSYKFINYSTELITWINSQRIDKNTQDIEANKQAINEVKGEVQKISEQVMEMKSDMITLNTKVQTLTDEVSGLKKYVMLVGEVTFNNKDIKEAEIWYKEMSGQTEKEKKTSFFRLFKPLIVNAAENDWYHVKLDSNTKVTFYEGKQYEVIIASKTADEEQKLMSYKITATATGIQKEETNSKGPFEETASKAQNQSSESSISRKQNNIIMILSIVLGIFGLIVLGVISGFVIAKRDVIKKIISSKTDK